MAEAEGWVAPGMAFGELARALFDGEAITDESRDLYAESIALGERPGIDVLALIIADAEGATRDLDAVNRVGTAFATGDETAKRGDVMKFERALVWAQKSHRSFATAVDTLAREGGLDVTAADTALSALNAEIEEARRIADALAGDLAVEGETGSGS